MEIVRGGGADTRGHGDDHTRGHGCSGGHMEHNCRTGGGGLQNTGGDHVLRALENLLGGLEHELDGSFQFSFPGFQELCRAQEHGGVEIVAAGVHRAVGACKFLAALLGDGQGIHIRPEEDAGLALADGGGQARPSAGDGGEAQAFQLLSDIFDGFGNVKGHAGMGVEPAAVPGELTLKGFGFGEQIGHGIILLNGFCYHSIIFTPNQSVLTGSCAVIK